MPALACRRGPAPGGREPRLEALDEEYVRAAIREIAPLVMECFEAGIARGVANDGDVVVRFMVEGEADIGAVITDSTIDASRTTVVDGTVQACIRDTMFALEIGAPPSGGRLEVRKRFSFHELPGAPATLPSGALGSLVRFAGAPAREAAAACRPRRPRGGGTGRPARAAAW